MHRIHTLRAHQTCNNLQVLHDRESNTTVIQALDKFVLYFDAETHTMDLYGLARSGVFQIDDVRYTRYIEGSTLRVENNIIFENGRRRLSFTKPSKRVRINRRLVMKLNTLELNGPIVFTHLASGCVDSQERQFTLSLKNAARLRTGLPVTNLHCTVDSEAHIWASRRLMDTGRLVWNMEKLDLVVRGPASVNGIYVTREFITTMQTSTPCRIDVGVSEECLVVHHPHAIADPSFYGIFDGRPAQPPRQRPVMNEHGMVVWIDDVVDPVPQAILDLSRAAYDEQISEPDKTSHYDITNNTKHTDVLALPSETACTVCMTNKAIVLLAGCGHTTTCIRCTREMQEHQGTCPICRAEIVIAVVPFIICSPPCTEPPTRTDTACTLQDTP